MNDETVLALANLIVNALTLAWLQFLSYRFTNGPARPQAPQGPPQ